MSFPLSLAKEHPSMVRYISLLETAERLKFHPHLMERAENREIDDVRREQEEEEEKRNGDNDSSGDGDGGGGAARGDYNSNSGAVSLRHRGLKEFSLQLLSSPSTQQPSLYLARVKKLDLSNNELSTLPGISSLPNLEVLCIKRNWFGSLPYDIGKCAELRVIDASRNFLKPKDDSLHFGQLKLLRHLKVLDVTLNQKCRTAEHRSLIQSSLLPELKGLEVRVTVWQEASNAGHNCVGKSAAVRNPALLRSQLEPWGTFHLRRRLVRDFGEEPTDPSKVDRTGVMEMLLGCYQNEGLLRLPGNDSDSSSAPDNEHDTDLNTGIGTRRTINIDGAAVRKELVEELLVELRNWRGNRKRGGCSNNRERPSINARCYMILCAPNFKDLESARNKNALAPSDTDANGNPSNKNEKDNSGILRRDKRRAKKMEGNSRLWTLALSAMTETDPSFASRCSEIAVTYGFTGSPHIDRQNSGPFYGLALGNFAEGTGGIMVECSARILARVNSKGRLGKVDGRHPHWVDWYNVEGEERFSLIYYDTLSPYRQPGPAIFTTPEDKERAMIL